MQEQLQEGIRGILTSLVYKGSTYDLIVTDKRIIGAKVGNVGVPVNLATAIVLWGFDNGDTRLRERYSGLSLDQIADSHKHNFSVPLSAVDRGLFIAGVSHVTLPRLYLWVRGSKMRFLFGQSLFGKDQEQLNKAKEILSSALGPRLEFKGA
jgi:hypothetical protein